MPVEGAVCRGGSPTGIGVRLQEEAGGLVIFFAGGGVCLGGTCASPEPFDAAALEDTFDDGESDGLFRDGRPGNPVSGYDFVFVPNCTNDFHSGNRPDALVTIDGAERRQQLVGHRNVERYVALLAPYFSERLSGRAEVLAYGISAGSFGALFNYPTVAGAFAQPVDLIGDSGPLPRDEDVLTPLLQQAWRDAWDLDATLPPPSACPACYGPDGGGLWHLYSYLAGTYPDASFGLLSSEEDGNIRGFFDAGRPACTEETPEGCLSGDAYRQALYDLRSALPPAWATYYAPGSEHVFAVEDETYYDVSVGGTLLTDWLDAVLRGEAPRVPDP